MLRGGTAILVRGGVIFHDAVADPIAVVLEGVVAVVVVELAVVLSS